MNVLIHEHDAQVKGAPYSCRSCALPLSSKPSRRILAFCLFVSDYRTQATSISAHFSSSADVQLLSNGDRGRPHRGLLHHDVLFECSNAQALSTGRPPNRISAGCMARVSVREPGKRDTRPTDLTAASKRRRTCTLARTDFIFFKQWHSLSIERPPPSCTTL